VTVVGFGADGTDTSVIGRRRSRSGISVENVGAMKAQDGKTKTMPTEWIASAGPCQGDSGSPAFDDGGRLVGVMSRGSPTGCTSMVYTRVDEPGGFGAWVRGIVVDTATAAGEAPPAWTSESAGPDDKQPAAATPDAPSQGATATSTSGCNASRVPAGSPGLGSIVALTLLMLVRRRAADG
jgi:hypothetical protein